PPAWEDAMTRMSHHPRRSATAVTLLVIITAAPGAAEAQLFDRPWSFRSVDRAGLAVAARQVEGGLFDADRRFGSGGGGVAGGNQYVCGGPSNSASATGNSVCIIIGDGANGTISTGQELNGNV